MKPPLFLSVPAAAFPVCQRDLLAGPGFAAVARVFCLFAIVFSIGACIGIGLQFVSLAKRGLTVHGRVRKR